MSFWKVETIFFVLSTYQLVGFKKRSMSVMKMWKLNLKWKEITAWVGIISVGMMLGGSISADAAPIGKIPTSKVQRIQTQGSSFLEIAGIPQDQIRKQIQLHGEKLSSRVQRSIERRKS